MRKNIRIIYLKITHFFWKYPREYYIFIAFFAFALVIIYKLFYFTVLNHDYYQTLADNQQTSKTKNEIPRWNIFSSNENIIATTVSLDDLAIDPALEWNKDKLSNFLQDIVFEEICYLQTKEKCKNNLEKFVWVLSLDDFKYEDNYVKTKILEKIKSKINQTKLTQTLVKQDLTKEQIFEIEKLNLSWLYINWTNLYVNPEEIIDRDFFAWKIYNIINFDKNELFHLIRKRELRYAPILNKISITASEKIKSKIKEEKDSLSKWFIKKEDLIWNFIILSPSWHRYYPEKDMASNIMWYVDWEWKWRYWIEWYYDNILKGQVGNKFSKKDILWRPIDPIWEYESISTPWADITLTIDRNIQKAVEEIIDEDLASYRANSISVVIMNPKTWEILAMASNPRYDPNDIWSVFELEKVNYNKFPNPYTDLLWSRVFAIDNIKWQEFLYNGKKIFLRELQREEYTDNKLEKFVFKNKKWPWVYKNDIIQDLYEPWSIFKPIVMARAIDSWEMNRYDMYKDDWYIKIDNFKIKNVSSQCLWYNTFQNAMNFSCNVWMIRIVQKIWPSIFSKYIESFWIWRKTWIDLEWEVFWRMSPYERWSKAQLFTTSFGQWITATVLQMASVYSTIANWWIYYKPQIVKSIKFEWWKEIINSPIATHRVIKESTSKTMIKVLVEWVDKWVAKNGWVKWYSIAWKTWTAQIAYKWRYESWEASTMWFYAWFGPAEDPKFAMVVKIERPRSSIYGWETVAKTYSKIASYLLKYYAIPPSRK